MDRQPISLAEIVQGAVDLIRPALAVAHVELKIELEGAGLVAGDAARLQQVIWNLLSNAGKFTPAGGSLRVGMREDSGDAVIAVIDTGVGIAQDVLPHIFDRFRQADSSTTRTFGGLGLGLSIVRHIVEAHGGAITAYSAGQGQGTRFKVRLPLIESTADAVAAPAGSTQARVSLTGTRVLVVEDERDSRELLVHVLQEHGATVEAAASAKDALRSLPSFKPHVLVSDIEMPGTDGYELLRQIRRDSPSELRNIPAIALTAFVRLEDRERAKRAGFDRHIAKPTDPLAVVAAVSELSRAVVNPAVG